MAHKSDKKKGKYIKGVSKGPRGGFVAMIRIDRSEKVYLGTFKTEEETHQAYVKKYTEISGDFNIYSKKN